MSDAEVRAAYNAETRAIVGLEWLRQPFAVYDSAGNLVVRDRGSIHFHALFDTLGDDVPGGVFLQDLGADVHGPHPGFEDFCGIITPLIGS
jgi:hypothetical protein